MPEMAQYDPITTVLNETFNLQRAKKLLNGHDYK